MTRLNSLALLSLLVLFVAVGCGGAPEAPEISSDVAAQIAAEDEAVIDGESEL
ncbi:hypothetical protein [Roseiconus lacunae]|uniref:Uncharacterized protein n=1 Tax=Roseiconus lacunae TaxID=2605694 RepID=A0ABT7PH78_9BACT|nr:hypothetical protein [Roseiconus lacunae]MCD0458209.1 hypothetical protein [Roseiconus lacunae]MDM4015698.1 hypothetical protein [Roseiconus lacunae]WRQ52293.1 hypothetical protein U8335_07040 [Stieleria sp. HD01]